MSKYLQALTIVRRSGGNKIVLLLERVGIICRLLVEIAGLRDCIE